MAAVKDVINTTHVLEPTSYIKEKNVNCSEYMTGSIFLLI